MKRKGGTTACLPRTGGRGGRRPAGSECAWKGALGRALRESLGMESVPRCSMYVLLAGFLRSLNVELRVATVGPELPTSENDNRFRWA